ncbi:hypothetical protein D3C85_637680 [compost metagenome]
MDHGIARGQPQQHVPVLEGGQAGIELADFRQQAARMRPGIHRNVVLGEQALAVVGLMGERCAAVQLDSPAIFQALVDVLDAGVDHPVRLALEGVGQDREVVGQVDVVIVQVGEVAPTGQLHARITRGRQALVAALVEVGDRKVELRQQRFHRIAVVADEDDLEILQVLPADAGQGIAQQARPVVGGQDDGEQRLVAGTGQLLQLRQGCPVFVAEGGRLVGQSQGLRVFAELAQQVRHAPACAALPRRIVHQVGEQAAGRVAREGVQHHLGFERPGLGAGQAVIVLAPVAEDRLHLLEAGGVGQAGPDLVVVAAGEGRVVGAMALIQGTAHGRAGVGQAVALDQSW